MKKLKEIREEATKLLEHENPEVRALAKTILSMDTALVMLGAQRNHWLSAFAEGHGMIKHAKTTLKKEEAFINQSLVVIKKEE